MPQRKAPVASPNLEETRTPLVEESTRRVSYFDPEFKSIILNDPIAYGIKAGWRDRQQYSRRLFDQMMLHGAVSTPFREILAMVKSIRVEFVAPQQDPTPAQREMAEFLNAQLQRLSWTKILDGWFGQGLQYGFSLAELSTIVEPWKNRPFIQVRELVPLPQGTLDDEAHMPDSASTTSTLPSKYTCFDFDARGRVTGYHQYRISLGDSPVISWKTPQERLHILHFKFGGGDGNPFGESLLLPAVQHWADLYLIERQEQVQLENSVPFITASYESDEPKPELHEQFGVYVSESDPTKRVLIGNNMTFGKISQTDPDYVSHVEKKIARLSRYITQSMLMPTSVYGETGQKDLDTRNLSQTFLKFVLPSILEEMGEVMTNQFGKRLVDANWTNVEHADYPRFTYRFVTPNDLRLVTSILQMALPHLDSEKLGEVFADYLPMFRKEYIASTHEQSVTVKRPASLPETTGPNDPPPKESGEERARIDGQTESVGQVTGSDV